MPTVDLSFTALPAHVRTARLIASAVARRSGMPDELLDEIRLAVGEACSRAVSVHRAHRPDEPVRLLLSDDDRRFTITVLDRGPVGVEVAEADSGLVEAPDLVDAAELTAPAPRSPAGSVDPRGPAATPADGAPPDRPDGTLDLMPAGFGVAIIVGLVEDVEVASDEPDGGTRITMRWSRDGSPS